MPSRFIAKRRRTSAYNIRLEKARQSARDISIDFPDGVLPDVNMPPKHDLEDTPEYREVIDERKRRVRAERSSSLCVHCGKPTNKPQSGEGVLYCSMDCWKQHMKCRAIEGKEAE